MCEQHSRKSDDRADRADAAASEDRPLTALHPLIRLLARQAARDFFNAHLAKVTEHDDLPH
ncbi:MAG: hypothetical protein RIC85_05285 [Gammaproteobacteria bacterium]|uniref:hypothetical protein n=1 Tax=Thalassobaculum sp. TaxID=2022740 RepID=UPI0032ECB9EA